MPVHADIDSLKREIADLQKKVTSAQEEMRKATKALEDNQNAQRKASGNELKRLKNEAINLANTEHEAGERLRTAKAGLASKQGELRGEASAQADAQIGAAGKLDARVDKARAAIKDWQSAIGEIPPAPQPRDLSNVEEEYRKAFRDTDINRLKEFERWADGEIARVANEIKSAEKLESWKTAEAKNGLKLMAEAKSLEDKLEARKKSVETARDNAKRSRESLEKQR